MPSPGTQEEGTRKSSNGDRPSPGYADYLANYAYNNVNEITQLTDPGDKTPAYDAAGNLTQGYTPAGYLHTNTFDGSNRLLTHTYTDGGGAVNLSEYHYLGQMLTKNKKYRNGAVTQERHCKIYRKSYRWDFIPLDRCP